MSTKKGSRDKTRTISKGSASSFYTAINEKPSDFWWNFAYFVILTTAITFILVNNPASILRSVTALIILGVLLSLDLYPALYMVKTLIRFTRNRYLQ